ncbi:hypothetical protein CPB84DRAFT_1790658, partial [Gymnopilus junonius]
MQVDQTSPSQEPQKVEELCWQKQFRVHRQILSTRSYVFRDMFSFPQPVPDSFPEVNTLQAQQD